MVINNIVKEWGIMNSESDFSINSNIASKNDLTKRATNSIESAFHDKNRRIWSYGKSIKIKSKLRNRTIESKNTYSMVDDPCLNVIKSLCIIAAA